MDSEIRDAAPREDREKNQRKNEKNKQAIPPSSVPPEKRVDREKIVDSRLRLGYGTTFVPEASTAAPFQALLTRPHLHTSSHPPQASPYGVPIQVR
jgi:hypothetical protein